MNTRGRRRFAALGVLVGALLARGCEEGLSSPTPTAGEVLVQRLQTGHFQLYGDRVADAVLRDVADRLETSYARVLADLSVTAVQPVSVKVWQDQASWNAAAQTYFGRSLDTAGYVTGPGEVRVLNGPRVAQNAVHEFCHAVTLHLNPGLAGSSRWLWETVALYENGERVDPRTLDYLVRGNPPTLDQLNEDFAVSRQIYEVGYLIGEFVVARFGQAALARLVRANGDTAAVLGLSGQAFQDAWYAYVQERYLS
jgi:hypothetical protein